MGRWFLVVFLLLSATACSGGEPTPALRATPRPRATAVPIRPAAPAAKATTGPTPTTQPGVQRGTVNDTANLRAEPSTRALVVGGAQPGQVLELVARDASGKWYQLADGSWIAAFLVEEALDLPLASETSLPGETVQPMANARANLRVGPGLDYDSAGIVEAGQGLDIIGRDASGEWYLLEAGRWIFAGLVDGAPVQLPVARTTPAG